MVTVKSTPVWRIAFPQVSPSIPTHAEAAPLLPEGIGTVKVPVTVVKVPYWYQGEIMDARESNE